MFNVPLLTEELSRRHLSEEHPSKQKLKRWVSSYVISLQQVRTSPLSTPQPGAAFHQPLTKCVEQMAPAKWRGNKAKGALCEVCVWVSAWAGVSVCAGEVYPNRQDAVCVRCVDFVEWMVILSVQRRVCVRVPVRERRRARWTQQPKTAVCQFKYAPMWPLWEVGRDRRTTEFWDRIFFVISFLCPSLPKISLRSQTQLRDKLKGKVHDPEGLWHAGKRRSPWRSALLWCFEDGGRMAESLTDAHWAVWRSDPLSHAIHKWHQWKHLHLLFLTYGFDVFHQFMSICAAT